MTPRFAAGAGQPDPTGVPNSERAGTPDGAALVPRYRLRPDLPTNRPGIAQNAHVKDVVLRWWINPAVQRPVMYGGAAVLIALCAGYGFSDPQFWFFGWFLLVAPAAIILANLVPQRRSLILAIGAGVIACFTTGESVYLGLAVAPLVFLSLMEDPAPHPRLGLLAAVIGSMVPTAAGEVAFSALIGTVIAYLAATFLRWHQRNAVITADLITETDELRTQASWLEQRTNLARELHDVVGHHVTAMVVQAEAGQVAEPEAALQRIADAGRTALQELDALVVHLRDPNAPLSVSAPPRLSDIDELLAVPLRQHGVAVTVEIDPANGLDEISTLTLYRVAQEALTNVARHAGARSVWVEVQRLAGHVRLRVSDDGVGPPATVERGTGLLGISERVTALNGTFELARRPGGGTMVDVLLPASPMVPA